MFKNSQRPPFTFFGIMRFTGDFKRNFEEKFQEKIPNIFQFFPHAGTVEENT